jgi:signal transduction histidine kinase
VSEGIVHLNRKRFSLNRLITETVRDYQYIVKTHTINIEVHSAASIRADKEKIRRVLINLLTNAVKYSPEAGKVVVSCRKYKNHVIVSV